MELRRQVRGELANTVLQECLCPGIVTSLKAGPGQGVSHARVFGHELVGSPAKIAAAIHLAEVLRIKPTQVVERDGRVWISLEHSFVDFSRFGEVFILLEKQSF